MNTDIGQVLDNRPNIQGKNGYYYTVLKNE